MCGAFGSKYQCRATAAAAPSMACEMDNSFFRPITVQVNERREISGCTLHICRSIAQVALKKTPYGILFRRGWLLRLLGKTGNSQERAASCTKCNQEEMKLHKPPAIQVGLRNQTCPCGALYKSRFKSAASSRWNKCSPASRRTDKRPAP